MAKGLRRTAFDQAAYDYWKGQYGVVNVRDYGAVGNGVHDDTAAIQAAWSAMGSPAQGTCYFPSGVYKISSTLLFDGGYTGAGNDQDVISTGASFRIICDGAIQPVAGIGVAVHVRAAYSPHVQLRFFGGGQSSDYGLQISDMTGLVFDVVGIQFAGTVLYYNGTETSNSRVVLVNGGRLNCLRCGAAFDLSNGTDGGFGIIDSIWDDHPSAGSALTSINDVSILHYENYVTGITGSGFTISSCNAVHLGKIALGNDSSPIISIESSGSDVAVSIDELYMLGSSLKNIGLYQSASVVIIGKVETAVLASGIDLISGNLLVGSHVDNGSSTAFSFGAGPSRATISSAHYTTTAYAIGGGGGTAAGDLTIGYLRTSNCASDGLYPAIDIQSSSVAIHLQKWSDNSPSATYALSIPNASQGVEPRNYNLAAKGIQYTSSGPENVLAGSDGGNIYWVQDEDRLGVTKKFTAYIDAYENDTTTNQTITFPTAYTYTPAVSVNTTGLTVSATTTTLTITAPDATTTYSGVIVVEGI